MRLDHSRLVSPTCFISSDNPTSSDISFGLHPLNEPRLFYHVPHPEACFVSPPTCILSRRRVLYSHLYLTA